jgi:hypothetical protein
MIGKPTSVLVASDLAHQERQLFELVAEGERVDHHHTQRTRKDGQAIDVSLTFRSIKDPLARVIGILTIATESAIENASIGPRRDQFVSGIDRVFGRRRNHQQRSQWDCHEFEQGCRASFRPTRPKTWINQPIVKLIPQDQLDEEVQILRRIRNGERIEHYDTKRIRKDGRLIDVFP